MHKTTHLNFLLNRTYSLGKNLRLNHSSYFGMLQSRMMCGLQSIRIMVKAIGKDQQIRPFQQFQLVGSLPLACIVQVLVLLNREQHFNTGYQKMGKLFLAVKEDR